MNRLLTTLAITVLINSVSVSHATDQLRGPGRPLRCRAVRDGPSAPQADGEISQSVEHEPALCEIPVAYRRPSAEHDLLLRGGHCAGRRHQHWCAEPCQAVHHPRPGPARRELPSTTWSAAKVTATRAIWTAERRR